MGEALEIAKVLVSPTMKLLDMVDGAIGTAYEPRHKRKMADATAHEINVIAEAMRNAADMPVVYDKEGVAINTDDFQRLMQRASTRLLLQETVKQHNIESIVDNAYEELELDSEVSAVPVDPDWSIRFFNCIEDISNEKMQYLWGKLLAGEVRDPGSFSLRTLEALKSLSQAEAQIFRTVCEYIIVHKKSFNLPMHDRFYLNTPIDYADIMTLGEAGLLNFQDVAYRIHIVPGNSEVLTIGNIQLELKNTSDKLLRLRSLVYSLTIAGMELFGIVNSGEYTKDQGSNMINPYVVMWVVEMLKDSNIEKNRYSIIQNESQIIVEIK